jgi:hypothetical protein
MYHIFSGTEPPPTSLLCYYVSYCYASKNIIGIREIPPLYDRINIISVKQSMIYLTVMSTENPLIDPLSYTPREILLYHNLIEYSICELKTFP